MVRPKETPKKIMPPCLVAALVGVHENFLSTDDQMCVEIKHWECASRVRYSRCTNQRLVPRRDQHILNVGNSKNPEVSRRMERSLRALKG